jgi:hypothetical protein
LDTVIYVGYVPIAPICAIFVYFETMSDEVPGGAESISGPVTGPANELITEFTFFIDAELYMMNGGELAATEEDLHTAGVYSVDIPVEYGLDLGERIPVRVRATGHGLRFYSRLLGVRDPMQLEELDRVIAAVLARKSG